MKKTVFLIIIVSLLFAFVGCDGELKDQHVWDEGTIVKQATCTQEGVRTFTCSHCSATKTEPVAALGHDFTTKNADEKYVASQPTEEKAAEYYYTCSRCGEKGTETFTHGQPHVHEWVVGKTMEATCTLDGSIGYSCSVCKATKADTIKALGHDFSKEVVDEKYLAIAAAEGKNPTYYKSCIRCEEKGSETFEHKHSWDEGSISKSATCTEKGEKTSKCTIEGCKETKIEDVQALGHDYEEVVDERYLKTAATKEKAAEYYESCSRCKEKGSKTFVHGEPLTHEHVWDNGSVAKEPGCVEAGEKTFKCTVEGCDGTKKEPIGALGHHFEEVADDEYLKNEASFTNPAVYYKSCTRCKEKSEETFEYGEVLPHEHDFIYEADAANLKFFTPTPVHGICRYCNAESEDTKELYKPLEGFWISESISVGEGGEGEVYFSFESSNDSEMAPVTMDYVSVSDAETQGMPIYALYKRIYDDSSAFLVMDSQGDEIYIRVLEDDVDANGNGFVVIDAHDFIGVQTLKLVKVSEKAHSHEYKEGLVGEPNDSCHFLATDCGDSHRAIDKMNLQHIYEGEADSCSVCGCYRYYKITFLNEDGSVYNVENVEKGADCFLPERDDIEGGWKVADEDYVRGSGTQFHPEGNTTFVFVPCNGKHSYSYSYNDYEFEYFVPYEIEEKCYKCGLKSGKSKTVYRPLYGLWTTPEVESSREGQTAKVKEFLSFDSVNGLSEMIMDGNIVLTISGKYTIEEPIDPKYIARLVITEGSMTSVYEIVSVSVSGSEYGSDRSVQFKAYEGEGIDLEMTFSLCSDTWDMHYHDWDVVSFDSEGHLKETSCEEHTVIRLKEPHSFVDSECTICGYPATLE